MANRKISFPIASLVHSKSYGPVSTQPSLFPIIVLQPRSPEEGETTGCNGDQGSPSMLKGQGRTDIQ